MVYFTQKHKRTIKFERIQKKSSSLGAPTKDNGRRAQLTISNMWLVNIILATVII